MVGKGCLVRGGRVFLVEGGERRRRGVLRPHAGSRFVDSRSGRSRNGGWFVRRAPHTTRIFRTILVVWGSRRRRMLAQAREGPCMEEGVGGEERRYYYYPAVLRHRVLVLGVMV